MAFYNVDIPRDWIKADTKQKGKGNYWEGGSQAHPRGVLGILWGKLMVGPPDLEGPGGLSHLTPWQPSGKKDEGYASSSTGPWRTCKAPATWDEVCSRESLLTTIRQEVLRFLSGQGLLHRGCSQPQPPPYQYLAE